MRPRSAARRSAILDAAFTLIVERGFEGLRLRDVADAVGINSATLIYYFADKEELIAAVVRRIVERLRGLNEERGVDMTRPDGLATHIAAIRDDVVASPATYIALCEVAVRARRHPKIAAAMNESTRTWTQVLRTLFAAAFPQAPARAVSAWASTTITFFWGLTLRANADGSFAALTEGNANATRAKSALRRAIDAYVALVDAKATRREPV